MLKNLCYYCSMKFFIYIIFVINLSASSINLNYIGELSIFGKVADASIYYFNDGKKYHIKVSGKGSGIIAKLTNNRHYIYESIGDVNGTLLIPKHYITTEVTSQKSKIKDYCFDYKNSCTNIKIDEEKEVYTTKVNIVNLSIERESHIEKKSKVKKIDKIYHDDMVSIFFNKRNKLLDMKIGDSKLIYAVGSKDTQNGVIVELKDIQNDRFIYSMKIKKEYLENGSNEAEFILDGNNILSETSINGILFFGDAIIKRVEKN